MPGSAYSEQAVEEYTGLHRQEAQQLMRQQAHKVKVAGADVTGTYLREGRPAEEISGLAEELGAGLVVVGSRGLGLVKRLTVGSVSAKILRAASGPVLITPCSGGPYPWLVNPATFS